VAWRRVVIADAPVGAGIPPFYHPRTGTISIDWLWWFSAPLPIRWTSLCEAIAQHACTRTGASLAVVAPVLCATPHLGLHLTQHGIVDAIDGVWLEELEEVVRALPPAALSPATTR
jgi:hypothetical protein